MEQPKMPMLILDLQKTTTYNTVPLRLTQGDKGYIQPFTLTNAFQQYTVTADVLGFRAMKPDKTIIEVEDDPDRFFLIDDIWNFKLPDELTQAVGTVSGAYFFVKDDEEIVASTTKFNYSISSKWVEDEQSNSYVSLFENLEKKLTALVDAGASTISKLNDYSTEAEEKLKTSLSSLTISIADWKFKVTAEFNDAKAEWKDQMATYNSQASAEIGKIETEKLAALTKIEKEADDNLIAIQADYATFKATITKQLEELLKDVPSLETKVNDLTEQLDKIDIAAIKASADKAVEDVANLTTIVSDKADKAELVGLAKSATVNGGTKIVSDSEGNLELNVPNPDLSDYVTKVNMDGAIESAKPNLSPYATTTAMNTAINNAKPNLSPYATTTTMNTAVDNAKTQANTYTDSKFSTALKSWKGTLAQYNAIKSKDGNTLYIVTG